VAVRVDGARRWYRLRPAPLAEIDEWLAPYRWMWASGPRRETPDPARRSCLEVGFDAIY
jgi:hypothetical protein